MSHQLSKCPNCRRTFIGSANGGAGSEPGRCRICDAPLVAATGEKEAEVQGHLYGRNAHAALVTRVPAPG